MWRRIALKEDKAVDNAVKGKDTFFLETGHAISNMVLTVRAKNESDHNSPDATEAKTVINSISNIKIEAGSRVFKDYSAEIALKWAIYRNSFEPYTNLTQALGGTYPDGWQEVAIPIDWNLFPDDRLCALPAPLYKGGGLKLSITYDFPIDDDGGQNAFLTGATNHRYDLYANVLPHLTNDQLLGLKVIEQTQRRTYTTKATGSDLIEMTTDGSGARQVMAYLVQAYKTGIREAVLFEKLSVILNTRETIKEDKWNGWQWRNAEDCDLEYQRRVDMKAQTTDDEYRCKIPNVRPFYQAHSATGEASHVTSTGDQIIIDGTTADDKGMLFLDSDVIPATAIIDFNLDGRLQNLLSMNQRKIQIKVENGTVDGAAEFHEMVLAPAILS
jgi:hypothetical protein